MTESSAGNVLSRSACHGLGNALEQVERLALDHGPAALERRAVVHRLLQVVGGAGGSQIERHLDVDLDHLQLGTLAVAGADVRLELHLVSTTLSVIDRLPPPSRHGRSRRPCAPTRTFA